MGTAPDHIGQQKVFGFEEKKKLEITALSSFTQLRTLGITSIEDEMPCVIYGFQAHF